MGENPDCCGCEGGEGAIDLSTLFERQVRPALGCTEIVAVGLGASLALEAASDCVPSFVREGQEMNADRVTKKWGVDDISGVILEIDRNVYKNAAAVGVPLPDSAPHQFGIEFGVALGLCCDPNECEAGQVLTLFKNVSEETVGRAKRLLERLGENLVIRVVDDWTGRADVNIKATVTCTDGYEEMTGEALIQHDHANVTYMANSTGVLYENLQPETAAGRDLELEKLSQMSLEQIVDLVDNLPVEVMHLVLDGLEMNIELVHKGLEGNYGARLGASLQKIYKMKQDRDWVALAKIYTAAACDARMGGALKAAMSTAGSGNQGIMATVPVIVAAREVGMDKEKLIKALAIAHLVTAYATYYAGELSAACGCGVRAGVGATAGLAYYLGDGTAKTVGDAINYFAETIPGMICDGAKPGCAMKLSTAVDTCAQSALLAINGFRPTINGIVDADPLTTIQNMGKISDGSVGLDRVIVQDIMNRWEG